MQKLHFFSLAYSPIRHALNQGRVKNRLGHPWTSQAIRYLLGNEIATACALNYRELVAGAERRERCEFEAMSGTLRTC
jgi:hypothetical protein